MAIVLMKKKFLRTEEAAELLKLNQWTIRRWVQNGRLKGKKVGKGFLISEDSIFNLVADIASPVRKKSAR